MDTNKETNTISTPLAQSAPVVPQAKKQIIPHTLVIIGCIILLAALLTYIIPAGSFDRVKNATGRMVVNPASFHFIAQKPASIMTIFKAIPKGFLDTSWICFLILIVGGSFHLVTTTGAIQAFLNKILSKSKGKSYMVIPLIVFGFSIIPTLIGSMEAYLAFIPLGVLLARSMGLDALCGIAMVAAGGNAGFASGIYNPFTIGTAQQLVGLPAFSAAPFRVIAFIGFNISVSFWTVKYAKQVLADKNNSIMAEEEALALKNMKAEDTVLPELDLRKVGILLTALVTLCAVVYTALHKGDFKTDIPAMFLMMMFVVGALAQYSPNKIFTVFTQGAQKMVSGLLVVGFAKAIAIILDGGGIIDTIVHYMTMMLSGQSHIVAAEIMYVIQYITNFFIISGSGQAVVTMPILSPIGDALGLTQQTVCAAFQYGDGITNLLLPMSPLTSGSVAIAGIPYTKYVKFIWKIILTNTIIAAICVGFAAAINLGPF